MQVSGQLHINILCATQAWDDTLSGSRVNWIFSIIFWIPFNNNRKNLRALYHDDRLERWGQSMVTLSNSHPRPVGCMCTLIGYCLVLCLISPAWPHCLSGFSHHIGRLHHYIPLQSVTAAECQGCSSAGAHCNNVSLLVFLRK